MKKISEFKLYKFLFDDSFDIRHKLQNSIFAFGFIGCLSSCIISFSCGFNMTGNIINAASILFVGASLYLSAVQKKKEVASYLASIFINLVTFPSMFWFNGGVNGGMPLWYLLGLVFPWLIIEGVGCYIMFGLNLSMVTALIVTQYHHPEWIAPISEVDSMIDILQSLISVAIILGVTMKYQGHVYKKQNEKLKRQDEELSHAMETADKANIAKSNFLINMSHEIRTPINAVLGMDEMILRECNDQAIIGYAVNISNAGQSLLSIINDVLDFSKIESGKMDIIPAEYEIAQLLNDCYNMISIRAEKKNLKMTVINDETMPHLLKGDEVRIRQIIINFLTNAVKYTAKGQITLKCGCEVIDENTIMLECSVEDTGMGISEENQKQLFSSFQRIDEAQNRHIEGTGLGLNISKQLVEMMGGTISVKSTLGKGSTFSFSVPQQVISHEPVGSFESNRGKLTGAGKKYREKFQAPNAHILVVDDVKLNIDVLKGLLKKTQVQCDTAYSGRECLGLVRKNRYNLILMDHLMPDMDGVETLAQIHKMADCPNRNTPVIALTANAIVGAREKYCALGFADYLAKPIKSDELEDMLLKHLPSKLVKITATEEASSAQTQGGESDSLLNSQMGIFYCCGDKDFYRRVLVMFAENNKMRQLIDAYESKNWSGYGDILCMLKGSALTVGAESFATMLYSMEKSLRQGNSAYIEKKHGECIAHYRRLIQTIKERLENNELDAPKEVIL